MAAITNTFQTYQAKGIREDLNNIISRVEPEETPFISNIGRDTATNTFFEHQTQALAAVDTANAYVEGDDVSTFDAVTPTVRVGNYTQIMRKTIIIAGTEEKTTKAGRASELNYQKILKGLELRRDAEAILLSNQGALAGNSTTARLTGSLLAHIKTNTDFGALGEDPVWTNIPTDTRVDGTQRAFTEAMLKTVLQEMFRSGAKTDMLMVGPYNKQVVSTFAGIAEIRTQANNKVATIVGAADIYLSDFGPLAITPNNFQRERDALLIDTSMASVSTLRPMQSVALAKTGDAEKHMMIVEWGLRVENERGMGIVADLTTTA